MVDGAGTIDPAFRGGDSASSELGAPVVSIVSMAPPEGPADGARMTEAAAHPGVTGSGGSPWSVVAPSAPTPAPTPAATPAAPASEPRGHPASRRPARTTGTSVGGPAEWWWALRTAAVPWVVARVAVGAALAVARELADRTHPLPSVVRRVHEGLLGWDAGWYEAIARHGYGGVGHASLRFFPLVPLLARGLSSLPGVGVGAALVVVANLSALGGAALLAALARRDTGDERLATRAAWLVCIAPPAFAQVMGYAEGTLLLLAVGMFLALRGRAWWWAAGLGVAAGLTRPIGVLLVVPALVEALRGVRDVSWSGRFARAGAVAGPAAGFGAFVAFVGLRYGDALAPLRVQQEGTLRGGVADPLSTLSHDASLLVHGHHLGEALHLPWALLAIALTVVAWRRWPASYGAFATVVLGVALTASNLDGFERYALSAFPLVLAAATVTAGRRVERAALTVGTAGLVAYAVLTFTNLYVP